MAFKDNFGPVEWSKGFYDSIIKQPEDNNNDQITSADVQKWIEASPRVISSTAKKLDKILTHS